MEQNKLDLMRKKLADEGVLMMDPSAVWVEETVKVGIEAQSPAGEGGMRCYSDISLENRTVENLRAGV